MPRLLSVDNIAFSFMGYAMSYLELCGTLFYLWSVWLMTRRQMLTWPVGLISVALYAMLFYQIRLYSDALEQLYYLAASVYGWWRWSRVRLDGDTALRGVRFSSLKGAVLALGVTLALSLALGAVMSRAYLFSATLFPEPASYPYLDALTTIMSFTAMWLLARLRLESWVYWILVDVIGIWLYHVKGVRLIALLYVVLLGLAVKGLVSWLRAARMEEHGGRAETAGTSLE